MARLFMSGAEINGGVGSVAQNIGPDGGPGFITAGVTRDLSVFRSGVASWKVDSAVGVGQVNGVSFTATAGVSYFFRMYVKVGATSGSSTVSIGGLAATTLEVGLTGSTNTVSILVAGVVQGSASGSIGDGNWHRIELKGTVTSTNWTAVELQVDGVTTGTWSGTQATGSSSPVWGIYGPGTYPDWVANFDDIALNDSTGATNNTYPGAGAVVLLKPTADSAKGTGWTDDAASTTSLFPSVDNTPPVGIADTTAGGGGHLIRNATSNASTNYDATMTTYTAAGVTGTVNAVSPVVATAAPVTTSSKQGTVGVVSNPAITNIALGATGTAGAFWSGLAGGTFGAGWKWSWGTMTEAPTVTLGSAPVMRITQVTSSTRIADVCFMGIYVDYTPVVVVPPTPLVHQSIPFYPRASRPS